MTLQVELLHNPSCSKSRTCLNILSALASDNRIELAVIDYIQNPLTREELEVLATQLGDDLADICREADLMSIGEQLSAIALNPSLLQRPIVRANRRAIIARPPERVQEWLLKMI